MSNVQMATILIQPVQNLVWNVLQVIPVLHLPKPFVVQDIIVKQLQHPAAFVQVGLSVQEVEQAIPSVLKVSTLATVAHPAQHVMLVITVQLMALLNQSSVLLVTSLTQLVPVNVSSAQLATSATQPPRLHVMQVPLATLVRIPAHPVREGTSVPAEATPL